MKVSNLFQWNSLCEDDLKDISSFVVNRPTGKGLEIYFKEYAYMEEITGLSRTYVVRDKESKEIVGYFSLKASAMLVNNTFFHRDTIPSVELSNFAVNDAYRESHPDMRRIGEILFRQIVMPITYKASKIIGIKTICIFALPEPGLLKYYSNIGFQRLSRWNEFWLHKRIKPRYDQSCIFMYQSL